MITYYELLENGTIGQSTPSVRVAKSLGLILKTDKEIVHGYDGRRYFKGEEPEPPKPTYIEQRLAAYPPICEQLDMMYHNYDEWKAKIMEIKEKYPKN